MIRCEECGLFYECTPMTDSYACPVCDTCNYPEASDTIEGLSSLADVQPTEKKDEDAA